MFSRVKKFSDLKIKMHLKRTKQRQLSVYMCAHILSHHKHIYTYMYRNCKFDENNKNKNKSKCIHAYL